MARGLDRAVVQTVIVVVCPEATSYWYQSEGGGEVRGEAAAIIYIRTCRIVNAGLNAMSASRSSSTREITRNSKKQEKTPVNDQQLSEKNIGHKTPSDIQTLDQDTPDAFERKPFWGGRHA
jgi:hypothetical protein